VFSIVVIPIILILILSIIVIVIILIVIPAAEPTTKTTLATIAVSVMKNATEPEIAPGTRHVKGAQACEVRIPKLAQRNVVCPIGEARRLDEEHRRIGAVVVDSHDLRSAGGASRGVRGGSEDHSLLQILTKPMPRTDIGGLPERAADAEERRRDEGETGEGRVL
jgi:hypothetical protein